MEASRQLVPAHGALTRDRDGPLPRPPLAAWSKRRLVEGQANESGRTSAVIRPPHRQARRMSLVPEPANPSLSVRGLRIVTERHRAAMRVPRRAERRLGLVEAIGHPAVRASIGPREPCCGPCVAPDWRGSPNVRLPALKTLPSSRLSARNWACAWIGARKNCPTGSR
jgi:hypothetical protein